VFRRCKESLFLATPRVTYGPNNKESVMQNIDVVLTSFAEFVIILAIVAGSVGSIHSWIQKRMLKRARSLTHYTW
jgi:hypothetical protein